jgi:tetratricopeptide (TPR) repeat protein
VALRRHAQGSDHPDVAQALGDLALTQLELGKYADAEAQLRNALAIHENARPVSWERYDALVLLGAALTGQKKYAEAEPLLLQGYEGLKTREAKIPAPSKKRLTEAAARVVKLYEAWGKPEQAAMWKPKLGPPDLPADVFTQP